MPDPKGLVQSNPANDTRAHHIRSFSTFDKSLSYTFYNTLRFGVYTPSFDMEGVPSDDIELNSKDLIDSLSLNAPFKGQIRKIKESFSVPNMAILPINWDRVYAQPSNGDDVPSDVNCVLSDFPRTFSQLWKNVYGTVATAFAAESRQENRVLLTALLRCLILGEYVYSTGSLLHQSGYRASGQFAYRLDESTRYSFDRWFDLVIAHFFSKTRGFVLSDGKVSSSMLRYRGLSEVVVNDEYVLSFRALLDAFRENPTYTIATVEVDDDFDSVFDDLSLLHPIVTGSIEGPNFIYPDASIDDSDVTSLNQNALNLSRVLSYQLVCAHFYSNSSIDFIYSAELYRQYIADMLYIRGWDRNTYNEFVWNGYHMQYDILSGHMLTYLLFRMNSNQPNDIYTVDIAVLGGYFNSYRVSLCLFAAWSAIFAHRKSLRFGDYFVGSRPRPLAPVNTDVSVNNNLVSVVDITRNIQAQRFANAVMRSRSKIEEYVKSLFGKAPAPDYHNPFFLTRQEEMIFGDDVQNTAEGQTSEANSRTANFSSMVGNHTFTFHNDDSHPCTYLQIISFDIRRAYTQSVDRQMLHVDRFDMFNPDFQYIGDQAVYGIELGYSYSGIIPSIFAYQTRDQEYKQRFDVASGGFVENLPGWILTDAERSRNVHQNIDPDFIRSYPTELDQFYLSLTGFSLGSHFHFICVTRNNVKARRPMAVDPQILA